MIAEKFRRALNAVTALGDPVRRRLYEAVVAEGRGVSRNELARLTGVARPLVAYHLDRLVEDGLLAVRFERQTGRTGPGAGRPAKLYFRPKSPVQLTLPPRDYELVARVMAEAIASQPPDSIQPALDAAARAMGEKAAREDATGKGDDLEALRQLLVERGYEPISDDTGATWLRNCVFDELADQQRRLVCGINLSLLQGMLQALPSANLTAKLQPGEGRCCVVIVPSDSQTELQDN